MFNYVFFRIYLPLTTLNMKNKKYLVIEESILEKLINDMIEKTKSAQSDSYLKWLDGNVFALETVRDFCKPLDETI